MMNREQLIRECKQGSAAAQKCLFDLYAEPMFMVCLRYLKNEKDAEERLLDGFFRFFSSIRDFQYKGDAALFGWIKRIIINECLMFLRKKNPFEISASSDVQEPCIPDEIMAKMAAAEIMQLILRLPAGYRTVFNLFAVEGFSHKEIASLLQISEGTSKSQLAKARNLLQKMLITEKTVYAKRKIN